MRSSESASRADDLTCDPSSIFTRQKSDQASCIFRLSNPPHRKTRQEFPLHFLSHPPRIGRTGINRVDRNPSGSNFHSQRYSEGLDSSLGGNIGKFSRHCSTSLP